MLNEFICYFLLSLLDNSIWGRMKIVLFLGAPWDCWYIILAYFRYSSSLPSKHWNNEGSQFTSIEMYVYLVSRSVRILFLMLSEVLQRSNFLFEINYSDNRSNNMRVYKQWLDTLLFIYLGYYIMINI